MQFTEQKLARFSQKSKKHWASFETNTEGEFHYEYYFHYYFHYFHYE